MRTPVVLASTSPYRGALLARLGLAFTTVAPEVDETPRAGEAPETLVARLAHAKALAGARVHPHALVIGADQTAVLDGEVCGKPGTVERAAAQLRRASGRRVEFHTGVCLLEASEGRARTEVVPFQVHFRRLTDTEIRDYLRAERPLDCAGSIRAEGLGIALFERLSGDDPSALLGLPLIALARMLREAGMDVLARAAASAELDAAHDQGVGER